MSQESIQLFYQELDRNPDLRSAALNLKKQFKSQEEVIEAFVALGASCGFHFNSLELVQYIFTHGKAEK